MLFLEYYSFPLYMYIHDDMCSLEEDELASDGEKKEEQTGLLYKYL